MRARGRPTDGGSSRWLRCDPRQTPARPPPRPEPSPPAVFTFHRRGPRGLLPLQHRSAPPTEPLGPPLRCARARPPPRPARPARPRPPPRAPAGLPRPAPRGAAARAAQAPPRPRPRPSSAQALSLSPAPRRPRPAQAPPPGGPERLGWPARRRGGPEGCGWAGPGPRAAAEGFGAGRGGAEGGGRVRGRAGGRFRAQGFLNVPLLAGRRSSRLGRQRGVGGRRGSRHRRALGPPLPPASRLPARFCRLPPASCLRPRLVPPACRGDGFG